MTGREPAVADRDWWMPHVLIAIFGVLVATILRTVPGWSAPLHVWSTLAAFVVAALAAHAAATATASVWRRCWRDALLGLALTAALGIGAWGLLAFGHRSNGTRDGLFSDAPERVSRSAR